MEKVRIILTSLAVILFFSNYQICEYFYKDDLNKWWDLKINIYALIIAIVFVSQSIGSKGWYRFVLDIGVGFSISSVIDKIYYNVNTFTTSDIYMILTTVAFATYNLINGNKQSTAK